MATRRLPCWRKWATEPMASTDHFFFKIRKSSYHHTHSVKQRRNERNQVRTFADDAASNAFGTSPEAASLTTKPRAPHARTRIRTQNAPTFCEKSHSLMVQ